MAHSLQPVCYVGKNGLSDALVAAVDAALNDHELVKVKFNDCKDHKDKLSNEMAERTESHRVGLIGNIAILYRQQADPEKRKIHIQQE